jgi:nitrite reductase (cytochrome c-552)
MKSRVDVLQQRTYDLMQRSGAAIVALMDAFGVAKSAALPAERIEAARRLHRKAQWRLDFVAAENSMGFHASQETARLLAEAIDYARQGELALYGALPKTPVTADAGVSDAGDTGIADAARDGP